MSKGYSSEKLVLSIDPSPRGLGYAVLLGPKVALDRGVRNAPKDDKSAKSLAYVKELIEIYEPDVLVVEDCSAKGSRRSRRVKRLIGEIVKLAEQEDVAVYRIARLAMLRVFTEGGAVNKDQIASEIASRFRELGRHLPPRRKIWMAEHYWMSVFVAVAFALAFFHVKQK